MNAKTLFQKFALAVMALALAVAALPVAPAYAAGLLEPSDPPAGAGVSNERLEKIWARELQVYERLGQLFDRADTMIERAQTLIDKASAKGKDVSAVQSALDAFAAAVKNAKPIYQGMNGIMTSHQGFDDAGKVTDAEKAKETVKEAGAKFKEIKAAMNGTGKALHDAVRAFREANKPPDQSSDSGNR